VHYVSVPAFFVRLCVDGAPHFVRRPLAGNRYIYCPKRGIIAHFFKHSYMGRGDKKTKKGKIFKGSFGKSRLAKASKHSKKEVAVAEVAKA
jgi:30S ribosomal protein S31